MSRLFIRNCQFNVFFMIALIILLPTSSESSQTIQSSKQTAICQWLVSNLPSGKCGDDAEDDLKAWRATLPPLETNHLGFSVPSNSRKRADIQIAQGFQAPGREELPFWPLHSPIEWDADPFMDRNWQFHVHAWRMIDPLILAWLETKNSLYITNALKIIADWHDFHVIKGKSSPFGWYDMSTGIRAMKIAFFLDRILREEISDVQQYLPVLLELGYLHAKKLMDPAFLSTGNHGLFQIHGLMALCDTVPFIKSCTDAKSYAKQKMQDLLNLQFSSEGIHLEHSPSYHFFAAKNVQQMLRSNWYDDFESVTDLMKKVEENKVWMVHPDKRIVTVGDSSEGTALRINFPKGDPSCINDFSRRIDCYLSRAFTRSGYGIVRSDWSVPQAEASMLFFMAAFHSTAHKLPDDLSFELFEFGERLLTNSGKYSYNEDHFRSFVESTRAHNTVTIDDQSHSLMPHAAYGSGLINVEKRGNFFYLNGEVTHRAIGTRHHRELLFAPRQWLLVIDHLDANTVRSFTQWFHFGPQIEVNSTGDAAIYEAKLANGRTIRIEQVQPGCSSELVKGRTTPSIQGWVTVSYGKMTPRYSLGFSCSGREKKMVTLFVLDPENREDALSVLTNTSQNHGASKILQ